MYQCVCICMSVLWCVCMYECVCMHICMSVSWCVCMYECVYEYVYVRVCMCFGVCTNVCMYPCMSVCTCMPPRQQYRHLTADQEVPPVQCPAAAGVSLSKELYSLCSNPPSCINGDLAIGNSWGSKCQTLHVLLWLKVLVGPQVSTPPSLRHVHSSCGAPVPSPGGFALD